MVDQVIVRWRDFMFGYTHTTEVTVDNWAERVKSLYMRGGNDTLEINGQEVSEGPKREGDTSAWLKIHTSRARKGFLDII